MFPYGRAVNIRYLAHRPMERLFHRTLVSSGAGMTSTARGELSQSAWFARVDDRRDRKTTKLLGSRVCFFSVSTSSLFCAVCKDNNEILRDSRRRKSIIYSKGKKKLDEGGLGPTHQSSPKSAQRLRGGERADGKEEEVSPSSLALSLPIVDLLSHDYNYLLPLALLHTG